MTQTNSTDQLTAPSQLSAIDGSAQMADSYAEQLMDELFEDVDRILDGRHTPPPGEAATATPPFTASPQPFGASAVTVPAMLVPVGTSQDDSSDNESSADANDDDATATSRKVVLSQWLPRLVLGAACMSVLVAFGFWLAKQQSPSPAPAAATNTEGVETAQVPSVSEEAAFGEYLIRSLNILNGQTRAQEEAVAALPPASSSTITTAANGPRQPNIIERVFVPVFQPNTSAGAPLPTPQRQAAAPTTGTSPTGSPAPNIATTTIPNIAPNSTHALIGILELGNRSAALFEINGVPQRVYVGEMIGSSGWSVASVSNQEVIVRRNGEVRSIHIGQQF